MGDGVLEFDFGRENLLYLGKTLDEPWQYQRAQREELEPGRLWERNRRDGFIESFLKIRTKTGQGVFLRLNRAQREYSWQCGKKNVVLKARQVGITTYVAARFFTQTITQPGTLSIQVTQSRESAEDIFRIVRRFWENLPAEAREGTLHTSHRNMRQLVFPHLDSEYCLASAAENAGRGRTIQNLHCSEVARWGREGDEALASLRAAVVPGGEIVLESTANGAGGLFYREWQRAGETGYTKHFFPWWFDEAYAVEPGAELLPYTEEEEELVEGHGLNAEQMAWRRKQWAAFRSLAAQEYAEDPVSCFRASGECAFELEAVDRALRGVAEPLEARYNGRLAIWLPTQPGREYVIGVDSAGGGVDGDYSCAEVIDRDLGTQCAELHGHWSPRELAEKVVELGKEYNTALLAVESNNHGHAVLVCVRNLEYPAVYVQGKKDGWETTVVSRPAMIENLSAALRCQPELFKSEKLLSECRTFVRFANGNTGASAGNHDDCVIAMAIAWEVRKEEAGRKPKAGG